MPRSIGRGGRRSLCGALITNLNIPRFKKRNLHFYRDFMFYKKVLSGCYVLGWVAYFSSCDFVYIWLILELEFLDKH